MNVQGTQGSPPTEQPAVVMSSHKAAEDSRGCRHLAAFCRHGMNVDTESRNVRAGNGPQRSLNPTLFVRKLRSKGEVTRSVLIQRRAHTHTHTHSPTCSHTAGPLSPVNFPRVIVSSGEEGALLFIFVFYLIFSQLHQSLINKNCIYVSGVQHDVLIYGYVVK